MAEIMFDEKGVRMVLLSRSFGDSGHDQEEMRVRFTDTGPTFFHFSQDGAPRKYDLTTEEADAFCEDWMAYRAELRAKDEAANEHLNQIIAEAYSIAAKCPAIVIEEYPGFYQRGEPAWKVSIPSLAWGHIGPIGRHTEFLEMVKNARGAYRNHQQLIASKATPDGDAA